MQHTFLKKQKKIVRHIAFRGQCYKQFTTVTALVH